jgi:2-methylcitrate dehydratase PrpD
VTVSERLIVFLRAHDGAAGRGVPPAARHEALRLMVNQLKASVGATSHPAIVALHRFATVDGHGARVAPVLWFGGHVTPEHAALINGALCEVLDFNDTYIPTFMHATSGVLPAVLAAAAETQCSGADMLDALALGIEVELACATILMPSGYYRGFIPGGLVGAIGGAAACGLLYRLDDKRLSNAIGLAMCTGFGAYEAVGSDALPTFMGMVARNGLTAARLAIAGITAPATAFEGEKGMLSCCSDESPDKIEAVLSAMGSAWRIFGNTYKTVPTETITHAPIECVLAIRQRTRGRTVARMDFGVQDIVVGIADERRARFGAPSSELEARFDLRYCAAAAWTRGHFTLAEMREACFTDAEVLDLRDRIHLHADADHPTFEGASLRVDFTDGSSERESVPAFLGTPRNRLSDTQLSDLFRTAASPLLTQDAINRVLDAAWSLPQAAGTAAMTDAAQLPPRELP